MFSINELSLDVMNTSVSEMRMHISIGLISAGVVVLSTIGQFNTLLLFACVFVLHIVMTTIKKCAHNSESL